MWFEVLILIQFECESGLTICVFLAGFSKKQETDTIILRGVPSRWFAEPRVSSKPSMLVTHTIFSTFGKIRHVNLFVFLLYRLLCSRKAMEKVLYVFSVLI